VNLVDELVAFARALDDAGVPYAVCGGVAVTLHGHVRSTKDIDLLVLPGDVDRILDLLRPAGWRFVGLPITFERGTGRERRLQRVSKIRDEQVLTLDLLIVGPVFAEVWASRIALAGPDGTLWAVSIDGLATMKRLAGRKQDLADLEHLGRDGDAEE
jgi:hypothetical protein